MPFVNLLLIVTLLVLPVILPLPGARRTRARIGVAAVFLFTAVGHFLFPEPMAGLIPGVIPFRREIVLLSGVAELAAAILLLAVPRWTRPLGIGLIAFLILALPLNIHGALARIPFGGHDLGPVYLLIRVPVQFLLMGWIHWFLVRPDGPACPRISA